MAKLTHFSTSPSIHNRIAHPGQLRCVMFCHVPAARRRSGGRGVRLSDRAWGVVSPVSLSPGSGATLFRPRGFAHSLHRHARTCSGHPHAVAPWGGACPRERPGTSPGMTKEGKAPRPPMLAPALAREGLPRTAIRVGAGGCPGPALPGETPARNVMKCHVPGEGGRSGGRGVRWSHRAWGGVSLVSLPPGSGSFRRRAGAKEDGLRTPLPSHPF